MDNILQVKVEVRQETVDAMKAQGLDPAKAMPAMHHGSLALRSPVVFDIPPETIRRLDTGLQITCSRNALGCVRFFPGFTEQLGVKNLTEMIEFPAGEPVDLALVLYKFAGGLLEQDAGKDVLEHPERLLEASFASFGVGQMFCLLSFLALDTGVSVDIRPL